MRQGFRLNAVVGLTWAVLVAAGALTPALGQDAPAGRLVVIGCLKQAPPAQAGGPAPEFTLTDMRGGPSATYRIDAGDEKVSPWVNSTLEVAGTVVPGSFPVVKPGDPPPKGPEPQAKLKVDKVLVISRGCK